MSDIPISMKRKRELVSHRYIRGKGIEVGALHHPLSICGEAEVRYLDRMPVNQLRMHYPELGRYDLVPLDIIDDGETLTTICEESLDFLIANHMLEHCENPLGTLRNHMRRLKQGACLYCSIPDKNQSFDLPRPLTEFNHLVDDDCLGPELSRTEHYFEWVTLVNRLEDELEIQKQLSALMEMKYSIHFHVWNFDSFEQFLFAATRYLDDVFFIEYLEKNDTEIISILRKC